MSPNPSCNTRTAAACPICGYPRTDHLPRHSRADPALDTACPSCGFEFHLEDHACGDPSR